MYIENPKTKGSGIICAIPQTGTCLMKCKDCFFQSGRSYLEPLSKNLPNLPSAEQAAGRVVRMNDGNDSAFEFAKVVAAGAVYNDVFYNTAMAVFLSEFPGPAVLTVNPGHYTDGNPNLLVKIPPNLMFVRFRANTWNREGLDKTVQHYSNLGVPIVVTFMAYFTESIPPGARGAYSERKRTLNTYKVIKPRFWNHIMDRYRDNKLVHSCGKDANTFACRHCGNCLREYYATKERVRAAKEEI